MSDQDAASRRAADLARQNKPLGNEFQNASDAVRKAAEAAHAATLRQQRGR